MAEGAVDKHKPGAALEDALDDAAARRVVVAPGAGDGGESRATADASGVGLEGVATRKGLDLDDRILGDAVGRSAGLKGVAQDKLAELRETDDGGKVVMVLGAVHAAAGSQAGNLRLFALDPVQRAGVKLADGVLNRASGVGVRLELEPLAPANTRRANDGESPWKGGSACLAVGRASHVLNRYSLAIFSMEFPASRW